MKQYIVYESPDDYPLRYVLRCWRFTPLGKIPDPNPICVHRSLSAVLKHVPKGIKRVGRDHTDARCVYDVWIDDRYDET